MNSCAPRDFFLHQGGIRDKYVPIELKTLVLPIPLLQALIPVGLRLAGGNTPAPLELLKTNKIYVAIGMETFNGVRVRRQVGCGFEWRRMPAPRPLLRGLLQLRRSLRIGVAAWVPIFTRYSRSIGIAASKASLSNGGAVFDKRSCHCSTF